jgi:hypothetical protein
MGREHKEDIFRPSNEEPDIERPVNPIHDVGPTVPGGLSREDLKGEDGAVDTVAHDSAIHLNEDEAEKRRVEKALEGVRRKIKE